MTTTGQTTRDLPENKRAETVYRKRMFLSFSIFLIFFVFYMGTAVIQTPQFKDIAAIQALGMPLGLLLSLCVFPVSWLLIIIYFRLGR